MGKQINPVQFLLSIGMAHNVYRVPALPWTLPENTGLVRVDMLAVLQRVPFFISIHIFSFQS